jgi:hypothetical protein
VSLRRASWYLYIGQIEKSFVRNLFPFIWGTYTCVSKAVFVPLQKADINVSLKGVLVPLYGADIVSLRRPSLCPYRGKI